MNEQRRVEKRWRGKISNFRVFGEFESNLGFRVYVYIILKLVTIIANRVMVPSIKLRYETLAQSKDEVQLKRLAIRINILNVIRYLNFVMFNIVVVDGCFFAARIILHLNDFSAGGTVIKNYVLALVMMAFIMLDFLQLFETG